MRIQVRAVKPNKLSDHVTNENRFPPAPMAAVAPGTGGENVVLHLYRQMGAAGRQERVQFIMIVNFNKIELARARQILKKQRGKGVTLVVMPGSVRSELEGFQGNPQAWKHNEGLVIRDLEGLVSEVQNHSHRVGAAPVVIVGFFVVGGGHAEPGLIAQEKLRATFPNSIFLPIVILSNDPSQYGWVRDYTWDKFEEKLSGQWALVVDNAAGPQNDINDRTTIGLTALDTSSASSETQGSLAQVLSSLLHQHTTSKPQDVAATNGFFRLAVIRKDIPSRKVWHFGFPLRRRKLVWTLDFKLEYDVVTAIKECLETDKGILDKNPLPAEGVPQVVAVTLPVKPEELNRISHTVREILIREAWWGRHKDFTNLLFGSINFPDRVVLDVTQPERSLGWFSHTLRAFGWLLTIVPRICHRLIFGKNHRQRDLYVTVTRLFIDQGPIQRLQQILHPAASLTHSTSQKGWGLGTRQHAEVRPQND